ncbi:DUF3015 domain-containing protein [Porticoccaceae bacterium]|nr:DUF3015 domain-containing protein [Porticoccaceae bacterium]
MNNIKSALFAVAISMTAISGTVFAEMGDKPAGSGPNPFVDCGIGASLFPDTHWAAVTSNIIWDFGTTALTSATASPETCQGSEVVAAKFINETYPSVIEETANGQGAHLSAMLEIFGCADESHASIIQSVRSEMGDKVSADDYASMDQLQKAADYYGVINSTIKTDYAGSCAA